MFNLTKELIQVLNENFNVDGYSPSFILEIYKKDYKGKFEIPSIIREVLSIELDRRYDMSVNEATITISNKAGYLSPLYYGRNKTLEFEHMNDDYSLLKPPSNHEKILEPFNQIKLYMGYFNNEEGPKDLRYLQFTGQIINVEVSEDNSQIIIKCRDYMRKLKNPIDPINANSLKYTNQRLSFIIEDLLKRAGIEKFVMDLHEVEGMDYTINEAVFELGTPYLDAIEELVKPLGSRIYCDRFGAIQIRTIQNYKEFDSADFEYEDHLNITQGSFNINTESLRNRLIVVSKESYSVYEDKRLVEYMNQEKVSAQIEAVWADTKKKQKAVANSLFADMRRKWMTTTVATAGNPSIEVGDNVKLKMLRSRLDNNFKVLGIKTSFSESGYWDVMELEFSMKDDTWDYATEVEGNYDFDTSIEDGNDDKPSTNTSPIRNKIIAQAKAWEGTLFQWGGDKAANSSHWGFDCSGFVSAVLRKVGLYNSRTTAEGLYKYVCNPISESDRLPGDLVFSKNSSGYIVHAMIYMGNGNCIGSSGGGSSTTTPGIARQQNACVKVRPVSYDSRPKVYGRVKGL